MCLFLLNCNPNPSWRLFGERNPLQRRAGRQSEWRPEAKLKKKKKLKSGTPVGVANPASKSGLKVVRAVPKADTQQDAKDGVQKFRVKLPHKYILLEYLMENSREFIDEIEEILPPAGRSNRLSYQFCSSQSHPKKFRSSAILNFRAGNYQVAYKLWVQKNAAPIDFSYVDRYCSMKLIYVELEYDDIEDMYDAIEEEEDSENARDHMGHEELHSSCIFDM
ncbi:hypothetical protein PHJA_001480900 [Phtheirospermum japonicum]|uniref:Uncharacterized protein n=1 Tax=Phtheirospermum japonicum TaxID=374723 RepID=A0A830CDP3_9LAMI|nr:hypothetical protein PHJA_001480900 [Phtheirospermum japonicum]